jgi:hypothetical protein
MQAGGTAAGLICYNGLVSDLTHSLDNHRVSRAAALTDRDKTVAAAATLKLVNERRHQLRTGAAKRMA